MNSFLIPVLLDAVGGGMLVYVIVDSHQKIIINGIVNTPGNALHSDATTGNQWYNNDGFIAGVTSQEYTPKTSGDYYVVISVNGCSSNPSNTTHFVPTGIDPIESTSPVKVYPNPVTNELIIELEGNTAQTNFEIINSLGLTIYDGTICEKTVIPTSNFAPGIYIIKLESGKMLEFTKIIKN